MSVPFHKQTDPNKQAGQHVYSFDREPYLKHSNVAPDVTLSDYIARKTDEPKKITFEEWWKKYDGGPDYSNTGIAKSAAEDIWDEAIKHGKVS